MPVGAEAKKAAHLEDSVTLLEEAVAKLYTTLGIPQEEPEEEPKIVNPIQRARDKIERARSSIYHVVANIQMKKDELREGFGSDLL